MKSKSFKIISIFTVLSVFAGGKATYAEGVFSEGDKLYIDVSGIQNYTVPLTLKITRNDEDIYYNAISPDEYKKYAVIEVPELQEGDIKVYMGGALESDGITPYEKSGIKSGDYISLGKYNGNELLWLCCGADENGMLFLSDAVLDAQRFSSETYKGEYSLNLWANSELKNCFCDPMGDLFSDDEKKLISETYQMQSANLNDMRLLDTRGEALKFNRYSGELQNSRLYSYYSYDKLFVPDIIQVQSIASRLGEDVLAAQLPNGQACSWWLRTPVEHKEYDDFVYVIDKTGCVDIETAENANVGIRPAFYLDMDYEKTSGMGTKEAPYRLKYAGEKRKIRVTEDRFKNTLYIDIRHRAGDNFIFVAANYDDNDRFIDAQAIIEDNEYNFIQWKKPTHGYCKFFLWDEVSLVPFTDAVKIINNY